MPHIVVDTETTGLTTYGPDVSEVIQLGAYCLNQDTMAPTARNFEVKMPILHPERVQPNTLGVFNHYSEEVWQQAVPPAEGWQRFADFLMECSGGGITKIILVGHNFPKFDFQLVEYWSKHYGVVLQYDHNVVDTLSTFNSWKLVTGSTTKNHSLKTMAKEFEVENPAAHDALCDAWTEGMCYALCLNDLKARAQCGPGFSSQRYLDEAYRRIGAPRNGVVLPVLKPNLLTTFQL